jgi:hypothetical protein
MDNYANPAQSARNYGEKLVAFQGNQTFGATQATEIPREIPEHLAQLESAIFSLNDQINYLTDRLAPVSRPIPPENVKTAGESPANTQMAASILALRIRVQTISEKLSSAINRLEL